MSEGKWCTAPNLLHRHAGGMSTAASPQPLLQTALKRRSNTQPGPWHATNASLELSLTVRVLLFSVHVQYLIESSLCNYPQWRGRPHQSSHEYPRPVHRRARGCTTSPPDIKRKIRLGGQVLIHTPWHDYRHQRRSRRQGCEMRPHCYQGT